MIRNSIGLAVLIFVIYAAFTMPLCVGVPCVETARDTIARWQDKEDPGVPMVSEGEGNTSGAPTPPAISSPATQNGPAVAVPGATQAKGNTPGGLTVFKNLVSRESILTATGIIGSTNVERAKEGLAPLQENVALRVAASAKVDDMFARQYFAHESPTGAGPSDLADRAGYAYITVGENLALGNFENDQVVVTAWMNSPGHRANIMKQGFQEIGVSAKKGMYEGREVWIAVQEFGTPRSSCPSINENLGSLIDVSNRQLETAERDLLVRKQEIEALSPRDPTYEQKVNEYNAVVADYNALIKKTRELIEKYNAEVRAFNACLAQYS